MKRLSVAFLALALLATPIALAQQQEPPNYVSIFTSDVHLAHAADYEAGVKKLWEAMKKAGADFPVFASQSLDNPGSYRFVTLLGSMADMDAQGEMFNKAFATAGPALAEIGQASMGNNRQIIQLRRDLGFQPDSPRVANDQAVFSHTMHIKVHPGHQQDAEAVLKEYAALAKKKGLRDGYGISVNVTGDGPVYNIRATAKSQADFYAQGEKDEAKMGADGLALRNKIGPMIARITNDSWMRRPDLSYQP